MDLAGSPAACRRIRTRGFSSVMDNILGENGLIANILIANKERLNIVFNKKEQKGEFSGHFCSLLPCSNYRLLCFQVQVT